MINRKYDYSLTNKEESSLLKAGAWPIAEKYEDIWKVDSESFDYINLRLYWFVPFENRGYIAMSSMYDSDMKRNILIAENQPYHKTIKLRLDDSDDLMECTPPEEWKWDLDHPYHFQIYHVGIPAGVYMIG